VLGHIESDHPDLARRIGEMAEEFQFQEILELLQA
jgi:hypothetical protein